MCENKGADYHQNMDLSNCIYYLLGSAIIIMVVMYRCDVSHGEINHGEKCYLLLSFYLIILGIVFELSNQVRYKPGCAATEDG